MFRLLFNAVSNRCQILKFEWHIIGNKDKIKPVLESLIEEINKSVEEQQKYMEEHPKKILGQEIPSSMMFVMCDFKEIENGFYYSNEIPIADGFSTKLIKWRTGKKLDQELVTYLSDKNLSVDIRRLH